MPETASQQPIRFEATLIAIDGSTLLRLPQEASGRLPSRGQVAVAGTIDGEEFEAVLEPDGNRGHWMKAGGRRPGAFARVELLPVKAWPEPRVPEDLGAALDAAPQKIRDLWAEITPMARWEWVRWVNATPNPSTRRRRVEVTLSKMENGKRRPCCFDLASCTDPELARNGRLREASS